MKYTKIGNPEPSFKEFILYTILVPLMLVLTSSSIMLIIIGYNNYNGNYNYCPKSYISAERFGCYLADLNRIK